MMSPHLDYTDEQDVDSELKPEWRNNMEDPHEFIESMIDFLKFKKIFDALTDREIEIIRMCYGLDGHEEMTLQKAGQRLGITAERVRQLKINALCRLRNWSGVELPNE